MNPFVNALFASNEVLSSALLSDHSYSWWSHPRNVYHNGINYFTTIGIDGDAYLHKYDGISVISKKIRDFSTADEHNAPSFLLEENDIYIVSHPRNGTVFYAYTLSYDLQTLSSPIDINAGSGFVDANYSQIFNYNNRKFIFCREAENYWAVTWSDDNGLTYSAHKKLFYDSAEKLYMNGIQDGEKIVLGGYTHPNKNESNYLWIIEFNMTTGEVTESGISLGNVYDAGWGFVDINNLTPLFSPSLGRMRFLDISFNADRTEINTLLVDFPYTETGGKYYLLRTTRSNLSQIQKLEIVSTGKDTYFSYFGGAYFVKNGDREWNNTIYLARNESDVWTVEEWLFDGTAFTKVQEIDSLEAGAEGLSLTRPEPPIDSELGGLKVIYQKGDYNESFTNWDNEIIGIK